MKTPSRTHLTILLLLILPYFMLGCTEPARLSQEEQGRGAVTARQPHLAEFKPVISGDVGAPGVLLKGLPTESISDARGLYQAQVEPNWSGSVTPILEGYQFRPTSRRYQKVVSSTDKQDYSPTKQMFQVSGSVGLEGVAMEGLPGKTMTEADGSYRCIVEYGWAGTVTPTKEGCTFDPPCRKYDPVTKEWIHEGYTARQSAVHIESGQRVGQGPEVIHPTDSALCRPLPPSDTSPAMHALVLAPAVLILVEGQSGMDELTEIEEDLRVMSAILEQAVEGQPSAEGALDPNGKEACSPHPGTQALYIHGYGVIFSVQTPSPLPLSDHIQPQQDADRGELKDPVWEQARRQVVSCLSPLPGQARKPASSMSLDPRFQARSIELLRHASNIRHLGPDHWVAIHLTSQTPSPRGPSQVTTGPRGRAVTITVQKRYIDSFASGGLDGQQFQDHVQVAVQ